MSFRVKIGGRKQYENPQYNNAQFSGNIISGPIPVENIPVNIPVNASITAPSERILQLNNISDIVTEMEKQSNIRYGIEDVKISDGETPLTDPDETVGGPNQGPNQVSISDEKTHFISNKNSVVPSVVIPVVTPVVTPVITPVITPVVSPVVTSVPELHKEVLVNVPSKQLKTVFYNIADESVTDNYVLRFIFEGNKFNIVNVILCGVFYRNFNVTLKAKKETKETQDNVIVSEYSFSGVSTTEKDIYVLELTDFKNVPGSLTWLEFNYTELQDSPGDNGTKGLKDNLLYSIEFNQIAK